MRRVVGYITQERSILICFDEGQGMVREVIDDVAVPADFDAVVIKRRAEIVAPVARSETIEFVESAVIRVIRRLRSVVPFSKRARCVAG